MGVPEVNRVTAWRHVKQEAGNVSGPNPDYSAGYIGEQLFFGYSAPDRGTMDVYQIYLVSKYAPPKIHFVTV